MEDSSSDRTAVILSSDSESGRVRRRRPVRNIDSDAEAPEQVELRKRTKQQRIIYLVQIGIFLIHVIFTLMLVGRSPPVAFLLVFHGVISPLAPMLYVIGTVSAIYGYLSIFRKDAENIPVTARASWFRRYIRWNKFFFSTWILATVASVFGCWQFVFAQRIDEVFPREEIVRDGDVMSIIRLLIVNIPEVLRDLTLEHGITPKTPPLDFVGIVGKYFYAFFFVATLFPGAFLYYAIRRQRQYNTLRFSHKADVRSN